VWAAYSKQTKNPDIAYLVLDVEGFFGNDSKAKNKAILLAVRLLNISDVIIYNCNGHLICTNDLQFLEQVSDVFIEDFADAPPSQKPVLITFQNRCNRLITSQKELLDAFPRKNYPTVFGRVAFANSELGKVSRDKNGLYLDVKELDRELNHWLIGLERASRTPDEIYNILNYYDKIPELTTIPDDTDWSEIPWQCMAKCKIDECSAQCQVRNLRQHQHGNNSVQCKSTSQMVYLCQQCLLNKRSNAMRERWTWWTLAGSGSLYNCSNHPTIQV